MPMEGDSYDQGNISRILSECKIATALLEVKINLQDSGTADLELPFLRLGDKPETHGRSTTHQRASNVVRYHGDMQVTIDTQRDRIML